MVQDAERWMAIWRMARNTAARMGAQSPEDVASETVLRMASGGGWSLPATGCNVNLTRTIARNLTIDELRRRRRLVPLDLYEDMPDTKAGDPGDTAVNRLEARARLRAVKGSLTPMLLRTLMFAAFGYSRRDMADILGIASATARSRVSHARKRLAEVGG